MLFVTKPDTFCIPCKLRVCKFPKTAWMWIIYHFLEIYKPPINVPIGSYQIQHLKTIPHVAYGNKYTNGVHACKAAIQQMQSGSVPLYNKSPYINAIAGQGACRYITNPLIWTPMESWSMPLYNVWVPMQSKCVPLYNKSICMGQYAVKERAAI